MCYCSLKMFSVPALQYRNNLVAWLRRYSCHLDCVYSWVEARGQALEHYQVHLAEEGKADSLEVFLVLLALDIGINVMMENSVWSTLKSGIDFSYPTMVLVKDGAIPCHLVDLDQCHADVDMSLGMSTDTPEEITVPANLLCRPAGGRLLALVSENVESQSSMSTDIDTLFVADNNMSGESKAQPLGKASPQLCGVCKVGLL